jgi:hypothetical protein
MRYAATLLVSVALLFSATDALAQDPMTTAWRDAQRLADCTKALDAACAAPLYDAQSYRLLNPPEFNPAKDLARYFDSLRRRGVKITWFETSRPEELFDDGRRVYTFVPYMRTMDDGDRVSDTVCYLIGLSADEGETWTFVDAEGFTPEKIRTVVPSYDGQHLPPTR